MGSSHKLVYFSGTGNTKLLAEQLQNELEGKLSADIPLSPVEKATAWKPGTVPGLLGLAFPVYDFRPPQIISDFISRIEYSPEPVPVFLLAGYGTSPGSAFGKTEEMLMAKNHHVIAARAFKTPGPAMLFYTKAIVRLFGKRFGFENEIYGKIADFALEITDKYELFKKQAFTLGNSKGIFPALGEHFSRSTFGRKFYRKLSINNNCTRCGICSSECPVGHLSKTKNGIAMKPSIECLRCLRCVQACPAQAINFTSSKRYGTYSRKLAAELFHKAGQSE